MRTETIQRTEAIAAIMAAKIRHDCPLDVASQKLLTLLGLRDLAEALAAQNQQIDWALVWDALRPALNDDLSYQRIVSVLNSLPGTIPQIAGCSGYQEATVADTLNALIRGGYPIVVTAKMVCDRAVKVFEIGGGNVQTDRRTEAV